MTPPSHILIGVILTNTVYVATRLKDPENQKVGYIPLLAVGILCSVMPDGDGISRYFGTYESTNVFMGHRGITHSLAGVAFISLLVSFLVLTARLLSLRLFGLIKKSGGTPPGYSAFLMLWLLGFAAGVLHLVCDLPSPSNIWKGIPIFFPMREDGHFQRIGGWNKIGWFDYHLIYLLIMSTAVSSVLTILTAVGGRWRFARNVLFGASLVLVCYVTFSSYAYIAQSTYSGRWKEMKKQEAILNKKPPWFSKLVVFGHGAAGWFFSI